MHDQANTVENAYDHAPCHNTVTIFKMSILLPVVFAQEEYYEYNDYIDEKKKEKRNKTSRQTFFQSSPILL
jgi:hypothetical protein